MTLSAALRVYAKHFEYFNQNKVSKCVLTVRGRVCLLSCHYFLFTCTCILGLSTFQPIDTCNRFSLPLWLVGGFHKVPRNYFYCCFIKKNSIELSQCKIQNRWTITFLTCTLAKQSCGMKKRSMSSMFDIFSSNILKIDLKAIQGRLDTLRTR